MKKTDSVNMAATAHRKMQASTTLNRKYVKRPTKNMDMTVSVRRSPKVQHFNDVKMKRTVVDTPVAPAVAHPMQTVANEKMKSRTLVAPAPVKLTAKELKDQAIKKALATAAKPLENDKDVKAKKVKNKTPKVHFGLGRVVLALSCAAAAVFAIVYFVNLNMPDISMRVAAMQTGIDASYPSYVPRDFSLSDITSEDGKITLNFRNANTDEAFSLIEEQSSWDSNALLNNFVKGEYGENYSIIREQGLTIYIGGSDAAWVNGGVVYKIDTTKGSLTKKQIRSIAVSL